MVHRIFLVGYMGSGKTSVGKVLARRMNLTFVDLDLYIEQRYHKTIALLFKEKGEAKFREIERLMLHEVAEFENVIISTGGGTPVFFDNMEYMIKKGVTIYLDTTSDILIGRLMKNSEKRPLISGKSSSELDVFISQNLSCRKPFYEKAQVQVLIDSNSISIEDIVAMVIDRY